MASQVRHVRLHERWMLNAFVLLLGQFDGAGDEFLTSVRYGGPRSYASTSATPVVSFTPRTIAV